MASVKTMRKNTLNVNEDYKCSLVCYSLKTCHFISRTKNCQIHKNCFPRD